MRLARLVAPAAGCAVALGSVMAGVSLGAASLPGRGESASHPNVALRAMSPAARRAVSPHLVYAHPGAFGRPGASARAGASTHGNALRRASSPSCPWLNDHLSVGARVKLLLPQMTLADKLDLMEGHNGDASNGAIGDTHAIPSLCVPQVTEEDGPAGVADGVSGATQLPAPVNDAATWDPSQTRQYGQVLGNEEWAKGNEIVYAPTINIDRDPRWGRNFESLSEDPFLTGALADAEIQGIQSQGPIAQVKHYAVYNVETNRNTPADNDIINERTLHEIYLPAFYDATMKGKAGSVMCSYSSPNGTFACQNAPLLSILEQRWGYKGFVGSDYGAVHSTVASANAGLDQEQASSYFGAPLLAAVQGGQVSMSTINEAVTRILTEMFRFNLFDKPATGNESVNASTPGHVAFAQKNSERGTVLLKNAGSILPLSSRTGSIAVIGPDGTTNPETAGGGSAAVNPTGTVVTPLAGISARAGSGVTVSSYSGTTPSAAAAAARGAKVAIVFANNFESEGSDLPNIALQNNQNAMIKAVAAANPHTIVVLNTGGPVAMPWISKVAGVLEAWYPGQQDGAAIASILFGDTNPSGHLPETFPKSLSQAPTHEPARFPGKNGKVLYNDNLLVGYRYYDTKNVTPLFPFGYGLSYTSFRYSNLQLSRTNVQNTTSGPDGGQSATELTVSATVTNTGSREGADVAQLYLGDPATAGEPARQLEGFKRVLLRPGQSERLTFHLTGHEMSYFSDAANGWVLPDGTFTAYVGDSSALANLPLQQAFTVSASVGARTASLDAPSSVAPGAPFTVAATFHNAGDFPLNGAHAALRVPTGWMVRHQSQTPGTIAAGQSVSVAWTVTAPKRAQNTSATLSARFIGSTAGGGARAVASQSAQVSVEPVVGVQAPATPPLINPGQSVTEKVALTNHLDQSIQVTLTPQPQSGVTVTPNPDVISVPAKGTATASFTISATAAGAGNQRIPVTVSASAAGRSYSESAAGLPVNVAYPTLSAAFDNTGISDNSNPSAASFDTGGDSFSEQELTSAGFAPGATFTHDGIPYTWPSAPAGSPDNVIGNGQAIALSGSGSTLGLLGASNNGSATGPVTVLYTDGTSTTTTVTFADWWANAAAPGGDVLVTTPDWNQAKPSGGHPVSVYAASVPIDPSKTVADVILPTQSAQPASGPGPFHVFAVGIGS